MELNEIMEIANDIFSAFEETGDRENISVLLFNRAGTVTNVYGESKTKVFAPPVRVIGRVVLQPGKVYLEDNGLRLDSEIVITVPFIELTRKGFFVGDRLVIDTTSVFQYRNERFTVMQVQPLAMLGRLFLLYKFAGKRVV